MFKSQTFNSYTADYACPPWPVLYCLFFYCTVWYKRFVEAGQVLACKVKSNWPYLSVRWMNTLSKSGCHKPISNNIQLTLSSTTGATEFADWKIINIGNSDNVQKDLHGSTFTWIPETWSGNRAGTEPEFEIMLGVWVGFDMIFLGLLHV